MKYIATKDLKKVLYNNKEEAPIWDWMTPEKELPTGDIYVMLGTDAEAAFKEAGLKMLAPCLSKDEVYYIFVLGKYGNAYKPYRMTYKASTLNNFKRSENYTSF